MINLWDRPDPNVLKVVKPPESERKGKGRDDEGGGDGGAAATNKRQGKAGGTRKRKVIPVSDRELRKRRRVDVQESVEENRVVQWLQTLPRK